MSLAILKLLSLILCTDGLAYNHAEFGSGTGQLFLDAVQCSISSSQLLECHSSPILTVSTYCNNRREAGVGCERKYACL